MHVLIATDGSKQSLTAARTFKSFADPSKVTDVSVLAVIRPLASVAFADDLSGTKAGSVEEMQELSFRTAAANAVAAVSAEFDGWGPKVHQRIRSGSPANEIVKAARALDAGLIVVASGSRGLSDTVLVGSTAQKVQFSAPCPVLVVRPPKRKRRSRSRR